ncbi:MAG: 50S ribosomal protein L29 [Chloroflexota bacterium]|nr:50S ribosomal protein L29 [Chloroflexota bacterium]
MQAYEIRNLTTPEIGQQLDEAYEELFNLRFQRHTGQLKNTSRLAQVRQNIARYKTIIRERELATLYAEEEEHARTA